MHVFRETVAKIHARFQVNFEKNSPVLRQTENSKSAIM